MAEEIKSIIEKIRYMFLRYGIKSVTMDDISRELGISKKTLYQHVSDKTELVEKVIELEFEHRKIDYEAILSKNLNALEEMFEIISYTLSMLKDFSPTADYDLKKYYPELALKITEARQNVISSSVLSNIEKGKKENLYRNDFQADIISRFCVSRFEAFLSSELFSRDEIISSQFINELFTYHIRGIANDNGLKKLEAIKKE